MTAADPSFAAGEALHRAVDWLLEDSAGDGLLPEALPETGLGESAALDALAPQVLGQAAQLDAVHALAHMDPPTPWITWATTLWNARLNQNLLHAETSPFSSRAEEVVLSWLAPFFGMAGGHFCSGSSLANLTALWAARDAGRVRDIVASAAAHLSVEKAARILGLPLRRVPVRPDGSLSADALGDLSSSCLVLTAGTTVSGAVDPLHLAGSARWTHVDAAWAGPLRLSERHAGRLAGIENADSVSVSAHKWFFQPKDSALVLCRDADRFNAAIGFGSGYLRTPNIGVQGSRGAAAIPLLATLLAWGRSGMAQRIERCMAMAETLADRLQADNRFELLCRPQTGINVFRSGGLETAALLDRLPAGMLSSARIEGALWLRSVAANPLADIERILQALDAAIARQPGDS